MKSKRNLWVIQLNKPSRLWSNSLKRKYELEIEPIINPNATVHIYITCDEDIKIGDWIFYTSAIGVCKTTVSSKGLEQEGIPAKKIILTTDQDLIANGVQKVPEDFLLWFVKNPNCEYIETEYFCKSCGITSNEPFGKCHESHKHCSCEIRLVTDNYKLPQEEPKQETLQDKIYQAIGLSANKEGIINQALATIKVMGILKNHMSNKETIEETAENLYPIIIKPILDTYDDGVSNKIGEEDINEDRRMSFIEGAKWQAERMYSEKDLMEAFDAGYDLNTWEQLKIPNDERDYLDFKEWLDQFKKHDHEE